MPSHPTPVDPASLPLLAGEFRFYFVDESWKWSAEVAQIHGYPAAVMRPTTAQVMLHKHPDDHAMIAAVLTQVRRTRGPVNTRHRIVDIQGRTHEIIIVGERLRDDEGNIVGNKGFYVDVTPTGRPLKVVEDAQRLITETVAGIADRRSVIEQVKGILMFVYRIDAERAFDVLTWRSQATNVKVRELAGQYLAEFVSMDYDEVLPTRASCDQLLLTAHGRMVPPVVPPMAS